MVDLMGVDHVGIGLDNLFGDHIELIRRTAKTIVRPERIGIEKLNALYMYGIESPEEWPNITRGLVSRGYSDQEIEKILGQNSLKLMERVIG